MAELQEEDPEARVKSIDAEIERLMGLNSRFSGRGQSVSRQELQSLKGEFGVLSDPVRQMGPSGALSPKRYESDQASDVALGETINKKLQDLAQERSGLGVKVIDKHILKGKEKEQELRNQLLGAQVQLQSAIDSGLAQRLEESGIGAGLLRSQVAAQAADRGMLRSTAASQNLNAVTLQEQEEKTSAKLEADQAKAGIQSGVDRTLSGISRAREKAAVSRDLSQLSAFEDLAFDIDVGRFQQEQEVKLQQMKLDAQSKAFTAQMLGGIAKGVGKIFGLGGIK